MEGNMPVPVINPAGWQTIYRRVLEWQQKIDTCNGLTLLADHNPDLPFSRLDAGLEVRKWSWQL